MKKWIFLVVIGAMFGYTIYTTVLKDKDMAEVDNTETVGETNADLVEEAKAEENRRGDPNEIGVSIDNIAPDFELKTLDGETKKLSDFRGEPTMLNFWGSWCPPCRAEMPDMVKFHEKTNMQIVAVNLTRNELKMSNVTDFVDEYGVTFPVLLDEKYKASENYRLKAIPTTLFLDKDGRIQAKSIGPMNYDYMMAQYEELQAK